MPLKYCLTMLKLLIKIAFLSARECSPTYGKITILNKSYSNVRITLSPSINWNYFEQRTNQTLFRNPDKVIGGNIIM